MTNLPDSLGRAARPLCAAIALAMATAVAAQEQRPDADQLVKQADALRQVYPEAVMQVRLTRLSGTDEGKQTLMRVAFRNSDASLIRVLQGADQGQQILMLNEGLWVKLPRTTRTVRITPMQRLMGDASVGDIGRMRWQADYRAQYAEPAQTTFEGIAAWRLDLSAQSESATYHRIIATVAQHDGRPLEAEFFLKSGKAFKAVKFGPVEAINDRRGVRRMEFRDLLRQDSRTLLSIEKVEPASLEPQFFSLETLGNWQ